MASSMELSTSFVDQVVQAADAGVADVHAGALADVLQVAQVLHLGGAVLALDAHGVVVSVARRASCFGQRAVAEAEWRRSVVAFWFGESLSFRAVNFWLHCGLSRNGWATEGCSAVIRWCRRGSAGRGWIVRA